MSTLDFPFKFTVQRIKSYANARTQAQAQAHMDHETCINCYFIHNFPGNSHIFIVFFFPFLSCLSLFSLWCKFLFCSSSWCSSKNFTFSSQIKNEMTTSDSRRLLNMSRLFCVVVFFLFIHLSFPLLRLFVAIFSTSCAHIFYASLKLISKWNCKCMEDYNRLFI